jgi:hypothetical protein
MKDRAGLVLFRGAWLQVLGMDEVFLRDIHMMHCYAPAALRWYSKYGCIRSTDVCTCKGASL